MKKRKNNIENYKKNEKIIHTSDQCWLYYVERLTCVGNFMIKIDWKNYINKFSKYLIGQIKKFMTKLIII